jgi:guanine deaminase
MALLKKRLLAIISSSSCVPYFKSKHMAVKSNAELLQRAIHLATENVRTGAGGPFAALIVKNGEVIAEAANSVTTTYDPTAHGEINAIRKACAAFQSFSLEGCEIYTSSEPCPMCLAAIYWARIEAIYYGNSCEAAARAGFRDDHLYEQFRLNREARAVPSHQLLADEAWESFQAWIDSGSKVEY